LANLYIYVDETGNPEDIKAPEFAVGGIYTKQPIPYNIVNDALSEIKARENYLSGSDRAPLRRGYFHATDDGKVAKGVFLAYICKNLALDFEIVGFARRKASRLERDFIDNPKKLHEETVGILFTRVYSMPIDRVTLYVAERARTFTKNTLEYWLAQLENQIIYSVVEQPTIPARFPNINVEVVDKKNPGIQVVDYLTWAARREKLFEDRAWVKTAGLEFRSSMKEEKGPLYIKRYYIKKEINNFPPLLDFRLVDRVPDIAQEELTPLFVNAERTIHGIRKNGLPFHAQHLKKEVESVSERLEKPRVSDTDIRDLAKIFIKLAHTVPLYDKTDKYAINYTVKTTKYVGLVLFAHLIQGVRTCLWWINTRYANFDLLKPYLFPK